MPSEGRLRNFWVSWYVDNPHFEIHSPWWISGYDDKDRSIVCAAVRAKSEAAAKKYIRECHDNPKPRFIDWRFAEERPPNWSPFNDRFRRAKWMKWEVRDAE